MSHNNWKGNVYGYSGYGYSQERWKSSRQTSYYSGGFWGGVSSYDFELGTQTAARTLSGDSNIRVMFTGTSAEGKKKKNVEIVELPSLPPNARLKYTEAKVLRGYVDSEIVRRRISTLEPKDVVPEKIVDLFSVIENARIAMAGSELYHGVMGNMEASFDKAAEVLSEALKKNPDAYNDIRKIGPTLLAVQSLHQIGFNMKDHASIMAPLKLMDRLLIENIATKVSGLTTGVPEFGVVDKELARKGLKEAIKLAEEADLLFDAQARKNKEEKELTTEEIVSTDNVSFDVESVANEIFKNAAEDSSVFLHKPEGVAYRPGFRGMDTFLMNGEQIKSFISRGGNANVNWEDATNTDGEVSLGIQRCVKLLEGTSSTLAVMRNRLERLLLSKQLEGREEKRGGGKLNQKRLVNAYNGDDNVFTKRVDDTAINTAVQLVVDMSGSMSGVKINLALQSALLLAETLSKFGVPFEIIGFRTGSLSTALERNYKSSTERNAMTASISRGTHRRDAILMMYFKQFSKRYQTSLEGLGWMFSGGANADGESLLYASESLMKRPEPKKLMMVLSDGEPAFNYSGCDDKAVDTHLKNTVVSLTEKGIDVIGIGIMSDSVRSYYKNNFVVRKIEDLPSRVLEEIGRAIA